MTSNATYLNILINLIVNKYFVTLPFTCLVHFYDDPLSMHQINVDNVSVVVIQGMENIHPNKTCDCRRFLLQGNDAGWAFEVFEFNMLYEGTKNSSGKSWDRKYLIIPDTQEEFANLFTSIYLTFVRDVLVIFPQKEAIDRYDLYTHKYTGTSGNNNPVYLDTWYASNMSFAYGNNLYPDKVSNQHGRELRAYCLFGMCKKDPPLGNEYNIIAKYVERFNFTHSAYPSDMPDGIYSKMERDGLLERLYYDDVTYSDICYGTYLRSDFMDAIVSIIYTYEVSVPKAKIKHGIFLFMGAFERSVWGLILVTMISLKGLTTLHRKHLQTRRNKTSSLFDTLTLYGYLVNQPSELTPDVRRSKLLKYLLLLLLFFNILLVTAFNSRLASVMVSPVYENDINTLEELARSDLKLMFLDDYYFPLEEDTRQVSKTLLSRIELFPAPYDYDLFREKLASGRYAIARNRRQFGEYDEDYDLMQPMYDLYKTITPDLFTEYYYIMLRKNSMHTVELERLVMTANEVGLMQFWEADGARRNFYMPVKDTFYLKNVPDEQLEDILGMHHLQGIFTLWCCGMAIAIITFCVEILITNTLLPQYIGHRYKGYNGQIPESKPESKPVTLNATF